MMKRCGEAGRTEAVTRHLSYRGKGATVMNYESPVLLWIGGSLLLVVVASISLDAGLRYGWPGFILGPVAGVLVIVITFGLLLLLSTAGKAIRRAGPEWPPCRLGGGSCEGQVDWHYREDDGATVLRCSCGTEYVPERDDRGRLHAHERLPDGTTRPYMVHVPFRGWREESEDGE